MQGYEIEGLPGTWHRVRTLDFDGMLALLGEYSGVRVARDFLEAGDGVFSAVNPRTLRTERYATVFSYDRITLFRQEETTAWERLDPAQCSCGPVPEADCPWEATFGEPVAYATAGVLRGSRDDAKPLDQAVVIQLCDICGQRHDILTTCPAGPSK